MKKFPKIMSYDEWLQKGRPDGIVVQVASIFEIDERFLKQNLKSPAPQHACEVISSSGRVVLAFERRELWAFMARYQKSHSSQNVSADRDTPHKGKRKIKRDTLAMLAAKEARQANSLPRILESERKHINQSTRCVIERRGIAAADKDHNVPGESVRDPTALFRN